MTTKEIQEQLDKAEAMAADPERRTWMLRWADGMAEGFKHVEGVGKIPPNHPVPGQAARAYIAHEASPERIAERAAVAAEDASDRAQRDARLAKSFIARGLD